METGKARKGKLSRRKFLILVGTAAGATALTACGATTGPPAGGTTPVGETTVATEATGAAAGGMQHQGQLIISLVGTGEPLERSKALSDAYKKVQPGVELLWEWPGVTGGEYPTWLGTQLAASPIRPDIVSGNYVGSFRGYVNFDQYRKTINPYTGNPWDKDLDWDFFNGRNAQGERIMLPTRSVHIMWFYNKALFEKAGVKPPNTWQEFVDVCTKLKEAGITPVAANYQWQVPQWLGAIYFDQYHINLIEMVRAQPGDWNYDPELDDQFVFDPKDPNIHNKYTYNRQRHFQAIRDGKLRYDTPEIADLVKNMAQIFPKYATQDFFVISDPYVPFLQQQVAIMVNATWSLPMLENDMRALSPERLKELEIEGADIKPFEWATFENPPMEGPLVKGPVRSVESAAGEYLSIIEKDQAQVDRALDFLMFWTSKPGYQVWNDASIKSGQHAPGGPLEVNGVEDPPELQERFRQVKFMGNAETNFNNFLAWGGGNLATDAKNLYKDALEGKISPEEFGKRLQRLITDNFDTILEASGLTKDDIDNPAKQPGT
jgi:ABC-type glycerol-3-phosphate transport system substrate-binding protein